jgi:hypothetical protein
MLIWNQWNHFVRVQTTGQSNDLLRFERFGGGFQKNHEKKPENIGAHSESGR